MRVILLQKVQNLGDLGDTVEVKSGYGRNYLIPTGRALPATPKNLEVFEERRAELERVANEKLADAQTRADAVEGLEISISRRAGDEGKLYGSVTTQEIAEAVSAAGVPLEKREIDLPDGPIRFIGEHRIMLHFHADVQVPLTITVQAEATV